MEPGRWGSARRWGRAPCTNAQGTATGHSPRPLTALRCLPGARTRGHSSREDAQRLTRGRRLGVPVPTGAPPRPTPGGPRAPRTAGTPRPLAPAAPRGLGRRPWGSSWWFSCLRPLRCAKSPSPPTLFLRAWRCPSAPSAPPQRVPKRRRGFTAARRQASDSDVPRFLSGRLRQDPACAPPPALGTRESPAR